MFLTKLSPIRALAGLTVASALLATPVCALEISGVPDILDGDTISIGAQVIRLYGIDAPENGQDCQRGGRSYNCGASSENALRAIIADGVACAGSEFDGYDRLLAVCRARDRDVSAEMVRSGHALAFRKFSTTYVGEEEAAKTAGRGLWGGSFEAPWDYRAARWSAAANAAPSPDCPIKGNINRKGERIYHAPWSRSYDRTRVSEAKGERWFCSEAEALEAGWRAPLR